MKRITILISFIIIGFNLFAQNTEVNELTIRDSVMIYNNSIEATIIETLDDGTARLKNIADPINDADGVNKLWVLNQGGVTAVDSTSLNATNGDLYLWKGGVAVDTTSLDVGYFAVGDLTDYVPLSGAETIYVTPDQLSDSIADAASQVVFSISLPINGTLSGSVAAAVEGTDYPTGWVLSASGGDLLINHGLDKYSANATVWYNTSGVSYRQLRNFDNAYTGRLNVDTNNTNIESISTFYTAYKLKIYILF